MKRKSFKIEWSFWQDLHFDNSWGNFSLHLWHNMCYYYMIEGPTKTNLASKFKCKQNLAIYLQQAQKSVQQNVKLNRHRKLILRNSSGLCQTQLIGTFQQSLQSISYHCSVLTLSPISSVIFIPKSSLATYHRRVGSCSPLRNVFISISPSAGLLRGTRWPAPLTVTMLMPWYSTNLPATCIAWFGPHFSITETLTTLGQFTRCSVQLLAQTCLSRYHGCHWVLMGRPSASTQYRDPITGTLPSASPLHVIHVLECCNIFREAIQEL